MPVQSIPRSESWGERLFKAPEGLSEALSSLANAKIQQIQEKKARQDLHNAFPDMDPGAINFLASRPPKEQLEYLQQYAAGSSALQQEQQTQRQQQEQGLQALLGLQQEQQQKGQFPYRPGFQGAKQQQYGGAEQQEIAQQIQQAQQQLAKSKKPISFAQALGAGPGKAATVNVKMQEHIDKKNSKFNEKINQYRVGAEDIVDNLRAIMDLIDSGKVEFGLLGNLKERTPLNAGFPLMNDETQQFVTLINDTVDKDSAFTKGVATNFKIKLKQSAKPHLGLSKESARDRVERMLQEKLKVIRMGDIRDKLIEQNGGVEPDNLETLTYKEFTKSKNQKPPVPEGAQENDVYEDESMPGVRWRVKNNEMIEA